MGCVVLRRLASELLDRPPGAIRIGRQCARGHTHHGRPVFVDHELAGSISHADGYVAVACTTGSRVGIDIELAAADASRRTKWVRTESVVKATGEGTTCPFDQVAIDETIEGGAVLRSYRGNALTATILDLAAPSGYVAALTVLADAVTVHCHASRRPE